MKRLLGLACIVCGVWSCSSDVVQPVRPELLDAKGQLFAASFTDAEGQSWAVRRVTTFGTEIREPNGPGATAAEIEALSDEEYAERFRPVSFNPDTGLEYRLTSKMDVARFRALRDKDRMGVRMRVVRDESRARVVELDQFGQPRGGLEPASLGAAKSSSSQIRPQTVFPLDERTWVAGGQNFVWPHSATVAHNAAPFGSAMPCTATLIGWSTAIGAAHCFHNGTTWLAGQAWAVGLINATGTPEYAYAPQTSCYWVTIPTAWIGSNQNMEHDYAVIDFMDPRTCLLQPGLVTGGWANPGIGVGADYSSAASQLDGYDTDTPPALPPPVGHPIPSLLQRSGVPGSVLQDLPNFPHQLLHGLDTTGGASGGGMLLQLFSNVGDFQWLWVGVNVKGYGWTNGARRLDWGLWGFIQSYSQEY